MAVLIADGFDSGIVNIVLSQSSGTLPSIEDAAAPRTGKVMHFPYGSQLYIGVGVQTSYIVLHFNVYFITNIAAQGSMWQIYNTSGSHIRFGLNSSGQFVLANAIGTVLGTGTTVLSANTWYNVQLKIAFQNSLTAGYGRVYLDGNLEIDLAAGTDTCYSGNQDIYLIKLEANSATSTFKLDDLIVLDSTGSANNDVYNVATLRVGTLTPNAAGDSTQAAVTGAGSNYEAMNSSESSYVTFDGTDKDLYNLSAPATANAVHAIELNLLTRKGVLNPILKISGTEYNQSDVGGDVNFTPSSIVIEKNPNNSLAWTGSDLSGLQVGASL